MVVWSRMLIVSSPGNESRGQKKGEADEGGDETGHGAREGLFLARRCTEAGPDLNGLRCDTG
jgi:hypothetical protein